MRVAVSESVSQGHRCLIMMMTMIIISIGNVIRHCQENFDDDGTALDLSLRQLLEDLLVLLRDMI